MKKIIIFILVAAALLCSCGQYNQPDVTALADELCLDQSLDDMTIASKSDMEVLFDIDLEKVESYSVRYSSQGGYADMIAIFKMAKSSDVPSAEQALAEYKYARYEDFKGYAPIEAEKIENGRVLIYDSYALLLIVPDIDGAVKCADSEFTK